MTSRADQEDEQLKAEGLLIEGEEREYVLELLLRETPMEACVNDQPTRAKPAIPKSKRKRNLEKKLHKRARVVEEATTRAPRRMKGEPPTERERSKLPTACLVTQRPEAERQQGGIAAETTNPRHHCRPWEGSVPHSESRIVPRLSL